MSSAFANAVLDFIVGKNRAQRGAPVAATTIEPVPSTVGAVQLSRGTRHPYAAMLLIDFILGKDGQEVFSKAGLFPARPDVRPSDVVATVAR